jgi:hypothetical protein
MKASSGVEGEEIPSAEIDTTTSVLLAAALKLPVLTTMGIDSSHSPFLADSQVLTSSLLRRLFNKMDSRYRISLATYQLQSLKQQHAFLDSWLCLPSHHTFVGKMHMG